MTGTFSKIRTNFNTNRLSTTEARARKRNRIKKFNFEQFFLWRSYFMEVIHAMAMRGIINVWDANVKCILFPETTTTQRTKESTIETNGRQRNENI